MNNLGDSIRNRLSDLSACSAVPQPTVPQRSLMQLFTCRPTVRCDVPEVRSPAEVD